MTSGSETCAIVSGTAGITQITARVLSEEGIAINPDAAIVVVLDIPRGYALHTLESNTLPNRRLIVLTDSPCAEYWEDLWELGPTALLACAHLRLLEAIQRVASGERYRVIPGPPTLLTPSQRRVLRLLARGYSNQQIAEQLMMQRQTVKNTLAAIYLTLDLHNRNQALLHYWGVWRPLGQRGPDAA